MGALNYFQRRMQAQVLREKAPELPELTDQDRNADAYSVTAFSDSGVSSSIQVLAHSADQARDLACLRWASQNQPIESYERIDVSLHTFQNDQMKRAILSFESFEEWDARRRAGAR